MVLVYAFAIELHWFPTSGISTAGSAYSLIDNLRHLVLPALALGLVLGTQAGSRWVLGQVPGLQIDTFAGRLAD